MTERLDKFKKVMAGITSLPIVITQIDPDAIGSAMLLRYIAMTFGIKVDIYYCGNFGHPQNRVIYTLYDLSSTLFPIKEMPKDLQTCALVDSSQINDARLHGRIINPIVVFDHHELDARIKEDEAEQRFLWIDRVGAATTLLIEMVFLLDISFPKNSQEATLAVLGVFSDTKMLLNATDRDIVAYSKMLEYADKDSFRHFFNYPLPQRYFEYFKEAVNGWKIKEAVLVTSIGFIASKDADQLAIIADNLIRMTEIQLAITWAIVDNAFVRISARCTDMSLPLHDFLRERFGQNCGSKTSALGIAEGGGLIKLPIDFWTGDEVKDELFALVKRKMEYLILEYSGSPQHKDNDVEACEWIANNNYDII
ncbi:TrkA-N domain-containing protein [Candidatus Magnetobacterium bavaricum]|uniref:TrkA-N domain-containing protein n=1 Tax=Candidatus Magnetobacterium bavaricum TaxID=29290 RepID=A0A0F3GK22_9BACT|nr:TrkA-N domain-containing protein [Candidatus Magnetobacterium bavaricum]